MVGIVGAFRRSALRWESTDFPATGIGGMVPAMTFGFSTLIDALSWVIVMLLGLKVAATITLLGRDRQTWFQARWSAGLWWSTKVTPILAVPCMITVALLRHRTGDAWAYGGLMLFVLVAGPIVVWRRFYRVVPC
jgi:hypothetical protein